MRKYLTAKDAVAKVTGKTGLTDTITVGQAIEAILVSISHNFPPDFVHSVHGVKCEKCDSDRVVVTPEQYYHCLECKSQFVEL